MISEASINGQQSAHFNMGRTKTSSKESEERKGHEKIEDKIDFNIGIDFGEKLSNAKTEKDLLALLGEGQAKAQVSLDKFKALLETGFSGKEQNDTQDFRSIVFNAVKDVVVDILMAQNDPSKKSSDSFDAQLSIKLRKNAPDFMEKYDKSQADKAPADEVT